MICNQPLADDRGGLTVGEADAITRPAIGRLAQRHFPPVRHRRHRPPGAGLLQICAAPWPATDEKTKSSTQARIRRRDISRGWWGEKKGAGILPARKISAGNRHPSLDTARSLTAGKGALRSPRSPRPPGTPTSAAGRGLCRSRRWAGRFAWKHLSRVLCYAASLIPEIADDLATVDGRDEMGLQLGTRAVRAVDASGRRTPALEKKTGPFPVLCVI